MGPEPYDFLVIGGGIAGLSAAAALSELGSTVVVEAEAGLGAHATGRSAAMFEENYGPPAMVTLSRASRAEVAAAGCLQPRGFILLGTAQTAAAFDADVAELELQEISVDQAREMHPLIDLSRVRQAAYSAAAMDLDADRLLQHFARRLRGQGGQVIPNARVQSIAGPPWRIKTSAGQDMSALHLVNAAGAWADEIADLAGIAPLGLVPKRRSMARVPAPEGQNPATWPMLCGAGEAWYAKPDAGALLVSPADADPAPPHDAWADPETLARGIAGFEAHTTYRTKRLLASWAGLRTFAPDGSIVLGPDPSVPSFVWCAGQGGYGLQSSAAAGRFLADRVAGRPSGFEPEVTAALLPDRLRDP